MLATSPDFHNVLRAVARLRWQRDSLGSRAGCSGSGNLICTWPEAEAWTSSPYAGVDADSSGDARYGDFSSNGSNDCEVDSQNWTAVGSSLRVRCVR
jgi:hypothetical protein